MRFARIVFRLAGVWGLLILIPLYFTGEQLRVADTAPGAQFYYGFLAVTLAWQLAFLVIASDPGRFRPLMLPAILEKAGYVVSLLILFPLDRIGWPEFITALPDAVLGLLFVAAFVRTGSTDARRPA